MTKPKIVAVNEEGRRVGESHPRAKLSDHEVDLLRQLVEDLIAEGRRPFDAYREAAAKFELHMRSVKKIVYCERRAQTPTQYRTLK